MSPGLTGARGPRAARRGSAEGGSSRAPRSGEARSWLVPDSVFFPFPLQVLVQELEQHQVCVSSDEILL